MKICNDTLIDGLLKATPIDASAHFTENTLAAAMRAGTDTDILLDSLLRKPAPPRGAHIADKVLANLHEAALPRQKTSFARWAFGVSVAACAAVAVLLSIPSGAGTQTESDYMQMSQMSDDITNLSTIIAQEEYMDIMRF